MDYLTILPPDDTTVTGPLPADVADWGRTVARRLSDVTRAAAEGSGSGFVAAGVASLSHHAWSAEPWTRRFSLSLRGGAPYRRTAGMRAVAAQGWSPPSARSAPRIPDPATGPAPVQD